jgi:ABC-2 type transport system permease protein
MFAVFGARRTRIAAQITAAIVGAGFIIGIQIMAIMTGGSMSRLDVLSLPQIVAVLPDAGSVFWWPARALMGEAAPLLVLVLAGCLSLVVVIVATAEQFRTLVIAASGVSETEHYVAAKVRSTIRPGSPLAMLRQKEWRLLARDPWLVSQTLMQILYLLPPAVLLWQSYGDRAGFIVVLAPVLVMALGQLAGGLAWLAVSGEDAPDLIAAAPIPGGLARRAKIEAVMLLVLAAATPFLLALMVVAPLSALIVGLGVLAAAGQAVLIQLWFRTQASRSQFRRRQTASKVATFAEAFSSIAWAGATCLAAVHSWLALIFVAMALVVLAIARAAAPAPGSSSHGVLCR